MSASRIRQFGFVMGVVVWAAAPIAAAQDAVSISPDEMRQAAILSVKIGESARALTFADALLERDPKDVTALLVRSRALRDMGDLTQAQQAARSAWRLASGNKEKFSAALLMAQALSSDDKRTRAQLWLRRARQVAPTPKHAAQAAQDFRYVRQRNPWATHLSFTLAPNTNINNGSSKDTSSLLYQLTNPFGGSGIEAVLGAASKALSGLEMGADLQTRYRFHQTARTAHDVRFAASYRSYVLSSKSKDDLEADGDGDVTGSDFAYGDVRLGYAYKQMRADRRGEFNFSADLGQTFYGGARYNSYLRGRLGQSYYVDPLTKLDFSLSADTKNGQRGADTHSASLSAGVSRKLKGGDGLFLGVSVLGQRSDLDRLEYDEIRLRGGYVLGREIMGTALQFGMSTSYRDYDVSPHDPSGRREFEISADVSATFRQIDYYGFNPTVSLSASTTNSNIGLYDVNRVGLSIGIASAF